MEATFGFLDLVGFSALTEAHGDDKAADVVERFFELAEGALLGGVRVVNCLARSRRSDPREACR